MFQHDPHRTVEFPRLESGPVTYPVPVRRGQEPRAVKSHRDEGVREREPYNVAGLHVALTAVSGACAFVNLVVLLALLAWGG